MRRPTCATSGWPSEGKDVTSREGSMVVAVKLIDENDFAHQGRMDFVDNVIDKRRAPSAVARFFPIPTVFSRPACSGASACRGRRPTWRCWCRRSRSAPSRRASSCYVVAADGTVQQKFVTFGQAVGQLRVVKDGLAPDDRVVVNGLMRARPGRR